jgi:RNA polymerase subunit RPABC4/transcription elongation factor Spt4
MTLTKCPECAQQVSNLAAACPGCGYPLLPVSPPLNTGPALQASCSGGQSFHEGEGRVCIPCPTCSRRISDKALKCPACGTALRSASHDATRVNQSSQHVQPETAEPPTAQCRACNGKILQSFNVCPHCGDTAPSSSFARPILLNCRQCGADVSESARKCPKCSISRSFKKLFLIVRVLILVAISVPLNRWFGFTIREQPLYWFATTMFSAWVALELTKGFRQLIVGRKW